ncbi:adenylate/guanylate cyclase domain-containing protein [bacterium SCSIO 12741]|nr:adenylate/guanylate cyclase domain-containing protein [bacterium SCSIO 12741]
MVSPKTKRRFFQVIPFGIICFGLSVVYGLIEKGILGNAAYYPSNGNPYHFSIWVPSITAFFAGILIGLLEVYLLNRLLQQSSFIRKMLTKWVIYSFLLVGLIMVVTLIGNAYDLGLYPWDDRILKGARVFIFSFTFWSVMTYVVVGLVICLFYNEVSDNIGQGILINFFLGKYHQPTEEERIFMFLDMKKSTTIAEELGHVVYFKMLREYYSDLSDAIVQFGGEIYQYVGDEVIISWRHHRDRPSNKSLHCFYAMKANLQKQRKKYEREFGVVPTFKAGLHLGEVTTGEIGVIKKEITFTGDVMNTTARIQALCNAFEVDLLLSQDLVEELKLGSEFKPKALGEIELRGRKEKVNLFTLYT